MNNFMMYVEEGLKQFYVATEKGWNLMPGARFYVAQDTADGRKQEPFAAVFLTADDTSQVGLLFMPERTGAPFAEPVFYDRSEVLANDTGIAEAAERLMTAVLAEHGDDLLQLQAHIEQRHREIVAMIGPMK